MTTERIDAAVARAARALAERDGTEWIFMVEEENDTAKRAADEYRKQARIAVGTFVVALRDTRGDQLTQEERS